MVNGERRVYCMKFSSFTIRFELEGKGGTCFLKKKKNNNNTELRLYSQAIGASVMQLLIVCHVT